MIDAVHFQNVTGAAFDLTGPFFPIVHEILRSNKIPAVIKALSIIIPPTVQIEQLKLPVFIIGNYIPTQAFSGR